ncbi:RcpC/CpaB family pilus assembly protein [Streptomyces sp. NPDC055078]
MSSFSSFSSRVGSSGAPGLPALPVPEPLRVPEFPPLRVRGGAHRLRRAMRRRRRALAAGLALTAAALTASGARGADDRDGGASAEGPRRTPPLAAEMVSAPVRIADAATVRLLRPGDRVDVIAAPESSPGRHQRSSPGRHQGQEEPPDARVVAAGARVTEVPRLDDATGEGGALVVLSVPRATATELAGAGATSRLAVTVC